MVFIFLLHLHRIKYLQKTMEILRKDTPFGISMFIAGVAMLFFSAMVFLGLDYHFQGELLIPVALVAISWIVVGYCVVRMCKSKQMVRLKDGWVPELLMTLVVLMVMLAGSVPCTNFMKVRDHRPEFVANVDSAIIEVKDLSCCYRDYAEQRCENYEARHFTDGKGRSLRRRLMPKYIADIEDMRDAWLDDVVDVNLWNIFTPRNVAMIKKAALQWLDEYKELSNVIYKDEKAEPFDMPDLESKLDRLYFKNAKMEGVDERGLLISGICFLLVIMPYMLVRRNRKFSKK